MSDDDMSECSNVQGKLRDIYGQNYFVDHNEFLFRQGL